MCDDYVVQNCSVRNEGRLVMRGQVREKRLKSSCENFGVIL